MRTSSSVVDRIKKLLQMTEENGCSAHEAAVAISKANDLMTEYNIAISDLQHGDDPNIIEEAVDTGIGVGRPVNWALSIGGYLATLWGLESLVRSSFRGPEGVVFIGSEIDVKVAVESYRWLVSQGRRLVKLEWDRSPKDVAFGSFEASFLLGFKSGVGYQVAKIVAERETAAPDTAPAKMGEIVAVKDAEVKEYLSEKYPDIKARKSKKATYTDPDAYRKGVVQGSKVAISKPGVLGA